MSTQDPRRTYSTDMSLDRLAPTADPTAEQAPELTNEQLRDRLAALSELVR